MFMMDKEGYNGSLERYEELKSNRTFYNSTFTLLINRKGIPGTKLELKKQQILIQ